MFSCYLNKFLNQGWSKSSIYYQIKKENPHLLEEELAAKANLIYKELNRLNQKSRRNDQKFYQQNILVQDPQTSYQLPDDAKSKPYQLTLDDFLD